MPRRPKVVADRNIDQRSDGRWEVRLTVTDPATGRKHRLSRIVATRAEARALRDQLERDNATGRLRLQAERLTLGEWLTDWLQTVVIPRRRGNTVISRRVAIERHLVPALGSHTLARLSPSHIDHFVADQLKAGLAPATVRLHLAVLSTALNHAVRMDIIDRNPASRIQPPAVPERDQLILTADQARALLAVCEATDRRTAALVAVGVGLGLRRGEALGLRWEDIDLEGGCLRVAVQQARDATGTHKQDQPTKTPASRRSLPVPSAVGRHLTRWRIEQAAAHQALSLPAPTAVFTTATGKPMHPDVAQGALARALTAAGLPALTFHDLRHSVASLLAALGVHPSVAMAYMGHSDMAMTMSVYTHANAGQIAEATARIGEALTPKSDANP